MTLVAFNDDQLKKLQQLSDKQDYPAAYEYMRGIVADEAEKSVAHKRGQITFFLKLRGCKPSI